jgi:PEP-CTERM motif
MRINRHQLSILTMSIATAATAAMAPAHGAVITQTLNSSSQASAGGPLVAPVVSISPGFTSSSSAITNTVGNGSGSSFANQYGAYAVSSNVAGLATGSGQASILYSILNDSASTQNLSLTFKIYGGGISTSLASGQFLTGLETVKTSYTASISANGVSKFSSSASITQSASGIASSKSGTDLASGDNGDDGAYSWGTQFFTVQVNDVLAGGVVDILALLNQESSSNVGSYTYDCPIFTDTGYGQRLTELADTAAAATPAAQTCTDFKSTARGFYGDPIAITSTTAASQPAFAFSFSPASTSVPVPGSLALGGLGLAAMAVLRRRKV